MQFGSSCSGPKRLEIMLHSCASHILEIIVLKTSRVHYAFDWPVIDNKHKYCALYLMNQEIPMQDYIVLQLQDEEGGRWGQINQVIV